MLNSIEAERARYHLSKEELAKKLNISVKTYYNWIKEETDVPSTKLVMMAKMFGTNCKRPLCRKSVLELKGYQSRYCDRCGFYYADVIKHTPAGKTGIINNHALR
jgi:DNA-binding XRE family transcriptional regulator